MPARIQRLVAHGSAIVALATFTGCAMLGTSRMNPAEQASEVSATVRSDADIMGVLHQSNVGEMEAGAMVEARGSDGAVMEFARMMIRDHGTLDRQGMQMAQQWGITPNPNQRLAAILAAEMQALHASGAGGALDRAYMAGQVVDHERTLALVDAAIGMAQRPELRMMLRDQVRPPVAMHLEQARALSARVGS